MRKGSKNFFTKKMELSKRGPYVNNSNFSVPIFLGKTIEITKTILDEKNRLNEF